MAIVKMVKAVSKVSQKPERRDILFAEGGKGAIRKHAHGAFRPTDSKLPVVEGPDRTSSHGLKWVNVVAPAYISGALRLYPSPA